MPGGYFQPFHPGLPNIPIPPYPGVGGPRFNPVFDGRYAHATTTNPYLNNLFEIGNMTQDLVFRDAGMRHAYAASGPLAYANSAINPSLARASEIYREAMGGGGGHGEQAGFQGGLGKGIKHGLGGAAVGAGVGFMVGGPPGAVVGGVIGGVAGFVSGLF